MSPLDPKSQETQEWLVIAKLDLGAAKKLAVDSEFSSQSVFHAQQCAEKAFKAFLIWSQERFRKDHDLGYLGSLAIKQDSTLKELVDEAIILNPYAVTTRYPGFTDDIDPTDVTEALRIAEKLLNEILRRLPKEVHP